MAMTVAQMGVLARVGVDKQVFNYAQDAPKIYPEFIKNVFDTNQSYMLVAQVGDFGMAGVTDEVQGVNYDTWRLARTKTYAPVLRSIGYEVSEQAKAVDLYSLAAMPVPKIMMAMDKTKEQVAMNVLNLGFSTATANLGADGKSLFATDHLQEVGTGRNKASVATAFGYSALRSAVTDMLDQKSEKGDPFVSAGPFALVVPNALSLYAQEVYGSSKAPGTPNNDPNVVAGSISKVVTNAYASSSTAWFLISEKKQENPLFFLNRIPRQTRGDYDVDHLVHKFVVIEEYIASFLTWRGAWGTEGA